MRNADVIVFVREGEVMETGCHEELMAKGGFYYQQVILQTVVEEVEGYEDGDDEVMEDENGERFVYYDTIPIFRIG